VNRDANLKRRDFLKYGAAAAALVAPAPRAWTLPEAGRLSVRPRKPGKVIAPGEHVLHDDDGRRAVLYVPPDYDPKRPAPLMLALHGATGSGDSMLRGTRPSAETHGVVVVSPSSRAGTWDAIRGTFGDDLSRIDRMLDDVFDRCAIDASRVAVGGFSDGASYALSIGLINGDLFTHLIGHSPGFLIPGPPHGKPKIFISHGRQDTILPIDQCGRRIVAMLKATGYTPRFDEFDGGHTASPGMREAAMAWFTGSAGDPR
jgi:predicted esterase